ncbi:MAG: hypothetical protein NTU44_13150 [Bacteroidetes bacterium]|nr:hypothetical protein [Bacteroidota bacterium]
MRSLAFILILFWDLSYAQYPHDNKRDHVWMFGYENSPPNFGGTCLDFNQYPVTVSYVAQEINIDEANASVCDTMGNLLFYTNAMYVANSNHQIMPNGDTLNPGDIFNWYEDYGYRMTQGTLILPMPGSTYLYYIFHEKLEWSTQYYQVVKGLYYTIVDMSLDGGYGDVIEKNIMLVDDTLDPGCITATRHANGRDWWIVVPKFLSNKYYSILLSTSGLVLDTLQTMGIPSYTMELSQSCFSPDGSMYVRWGGAVYSHPNRLEIFNFDRCAGSLNNYKNLWYTDTAWAFGVAISSNSQYMYISADKRIDQYDLNSSDIASTRQVVAIYDGFTDPLFPSQTRFFLAQLASDKKIYICVPGTVRFLHVIDQPDNEGISCNVLQHAVQLNTFNSSSMPNFPNFRLGPIDGSICDSLGIDIVTSVYQNDHKSSFSVWPNPAKNYFNYKIESVDDNIEYYLTLTDNLGRIMKEWQINIGQNIGHFDISDIQDGSFLLTIFDKRREIIGVRKLLILR